MEFAPATINILDFEALKYDVAKAYFEDSANVLQVSKGGKVNIDIVNDQLSGMVGLPNVYGLLTKDSDETEWRLRYVGQRKAKGIRQRLREHLEYCSPKTGSQLKNVRIALNQGCEVGIKLLVINHDELRHFFESHLINDIKGVDWNTQK